MYYIIFFMTFSYLIYFINIVMEMKSRHFKEL